MKDKVFLYRIKDGDDRDCCAYIEPSPLRFECGHYFGRPILHGSCYCNSDYAVYADIETCLTKDEYDKLIQFDKEISGLQYGITEGDERYQHGVALCAEVQDIYDKLNGDVNRKFFEKIQEEEKQYLKDKYYFSDADIEQIWSEYGLDYRDRSIVCSVWSDIYDAAHNEAYACGYIDTDEQERYFNFDVFGSDLLENDDYIEVPSGRIVRLSY